jgi:type I restriction-modification system DNA methylase subunit
MIVRATVKSIQDIMRQDVGVDGDAQRISQLCWMFFLKIIDDQDQELELTKDGYRSPIPEKLQWRNWAADPEGATEGREETSQAWRVTAEEVKARGYNLDIKNPHAVADVHGDPETLLAALAGAEAETGALRDQLKAILAEALAR